MSTQNQTENKIILPPSYLNPNLPHSPHQHYLDPSLRHNLESALVAHGAITPLLRLLSSGCEKGGWEERVGRRARELMRGEREDGGEGEKYLKDRKELVERIVGEVMDAVRTRDGEGEGKGKEGAEIGGGEEEEEEEEEDGRVDMAVPMRVVREGIEVVREVLDKVVVVKGEEDFWKT